MAHYINSECVGCGVCAANCPMQAIYTSDNYHYEVKPEECIDCAVCESVCPTGAIQQA